MTGETDPSRVYIDASAMGSGMHSVEQQGQPSGKIGPVAKTNYEALGAFTGRPLAIVTVGLPGRGKSYVTRRIVRFLSWLGLEACAFQVHMYRRGETGDQEDNNKEKKFPPQYFDHNNSDSSEKRDAHVTQALNDMIEWMRKGGKIGILDGQNVQQKRREIIHSKLAEVLDEDRILFLEVTEDDPIRLHRYKKLTLKNSSSFSSLTELEASAQFDERLTFYEEAYEPLIDSVSYIRMGNGGSDLEVNRVHGYVPCRVANFLLNVNLSMQPIFLSRHGQSDYNLLGRIGGNSGLTPFGEQYAQELRLWLLDHAPPGLEIWCSTLLRTRMTSLPLLGSFPVVYWRALEEIDAGIYDGLTYEEIKERAAEEYNRRQKDKYWYRYPSGESYHDLTARLEPVIVEAERSKKPLLIISHQAVLRVIYAYLVDRKPEFCTNLSMPLHTVVKVC